MQEQSDYDLGTIEVKKSVIDLAALGKLDSLINLVEEVLHRLSNRDFIKFDEKYIKFVILTYLGLSQTYTIKSEYEVDDGYVDIAFFKRNPEEDIYEGLIELKYIKKRDYELQGGKLIAEALTKAKEQLNAYSGSPEFKARKKLLKWILIFVGDQCVEKVLL